MSQDCSKGQRWLFAAALAGCALAKEKLTLTVWHWLQEPVESVPRELFLEIANESREAAAEGNPLAQYVMGCLYRDGRGLPRDTKEAVLWLKKAASQGRVAAHSALGRIFERNCNYDEAFDHYLEAAKGRDGTAQNFIAKCYLNGWSNRAAIDIRSAYVWY